MGGLRTTVCEVASCEIENAPCVGRARGGLVPGLRGTFRCEHALVVPQPAPLENAGQVESPGRGSVCFREIRCRAVAGVEPGLPLPATQHPPLIANMAGCVNSQFRVYGEQCFGTYELLR